MRLGRSHCPWERSWVTSIVAPEENLSHISSTSPAQKFPCARDRVHSRIWWNLGDSGRFRHFAPCERRQDHVRSLRSCFPAPLSSWKRPVRWLKHAWNRTVEVDLTDWTSGYTQPQDREDWRRVVEMATVLRVANNWWSYCIFLCHLCMYYECIMIGMVFRKRYAVNTRMQ